METLNFNTMKTIYLNMRTVYGVETVDQFTQGEDAPQEPKEFRKYVNGMARNYTEAGMQVYQSQRATKDWKNK